MKARRGGTTTTSTTSAASNAANATNTSKMPVVKRINVANQAVADELVATTQVLYIQTEENNRQRDHVSLLGGEVDALKKVIDGKQQVMNQKIKTIADRDDTIADLRKSLHELKIERSAFKVMEDQNSAMLKSFANNFKTIELLENELRALKAAQGDVRAYGDAKLKQAVQVEVILNANLSDLTLRLHQAEIDKAAAEATQFGLKNQVLELQKHIKMIDELRVEQMQRSRQTEFKTLRRIDEMSSKYQHERDEKDKMRETVKLAQLRGDFLEERLNNALEKKNEEQMMVETLVSQAEYSNDAMRTREQHLQREHASLQAKFKLSQKAVSELIRRYQKLEGMYDDAKEEAFQATLYAKTHHLDRKAYMLQQASSAQGSQEGGLPSLQSQDGGWAGSHVILKGDSSLMPRTVRKAHPEAPQLRAQTPKPPVPNPLTATRLFISTLGDLVEQADGSTYSDFNSSIQDDERTQATGVDLSRDLLDDILAQEEKEQHQADDDYYYQQYHQYEHDGSGGGGGGGMSDFRSVVHTNTMPGQTTAGDYTNSYSRSSAPAPPPQASSLPELITTDGWQHGGKRNLLLTHLNFLLNAQQQLRPGRALEAISLPYCALTDDDLLMVMQYLRLFSLQRVRRIDLSNNLLTSKSTDALAAWIIAIPSQDLTGRQAVLEIDIRQNNFSRRSISKLGLKIKSTPRPEVPLVAFEQDSSVVALYSSTTPLIKIDARSNSPPKGAPTIKQFVKLPPSIADSTNISVRFPGEPGDEVGIIYPRDAIFAAKTL